MPGRASTGDSRDSRRSEPEPHPHQWRSHRRSPGLHRSTFLFLHPLSTLSFYHKPAKLSSVFVKKNKKKLFSKNLLTFFWLCSIMIMSGGDANPSPSEGRPQRAEQGDAKWRSTSLPADLYPSTAKPAKHWSECSRRDPLGIADYLPRNFSKTP